MFFTHLSTADISFVHQLSNLHGMWVGDPVTVPARRSRDSSNPTCGVSQFPEGAWDSVHADFLRRQRERFNSNVPFTEEGELYVKHTPHITFKDNGTAHVLVGEAGVATHPMTGSPMVLTAAANRTGSQKSTSRILKQTRSWQWKLLTAPEWILPPWTLTYPRAPSHCRHLPGVTSMVFGLVLLQRLQLELHLMAVLIIPQLPFLLLRLLLRVQHSSLLSSSCKENAIPQASSRSSSRLTV